MDPYHTMYFSIFAQRHSRNLRRLHDLPDSDDVVSVTSKEVLAISGPGEGKSLGLLTVLGGGLGLELVNEDSLLEVKDLDGGGGGSTEPVSVGGEAHGVDLITSGEGVKSGGGGKVPKEDGTVLAGRSAQRSIGGDGDGADVAGVAEVVSLEGAGVEVPDLWLVCCVFLGGGQKRRKNYNERQAKETVSEILDFCLIPKGLK